MIELIVVIVILGLLAAIAAVSYRVVVDNSQREALRHTGLQFEKEARALAAFGQDAPAKHSTEVKADLSSGWSVTPDTTDARKVLLKRTSDGAWVCVYLAPSYATPGQVAGIGLPGDTTVTSASGCVKPSDAAPDLSDGTGALPTVSYADAVAASAPNAAWHLGDASTGTAQPWAGAWPVTATSVGQGPSLVAGAADGAATFTTASTLTTGYNATSISSYSAELWVKSTATNSVEFIADRGAAPGPGQSVTLGMGGSPAGGCGPGRPFVGADADNVFIGTCAPTAINDGARHYVAATWKGTSGQAVTCAQFTLYIDGTAVPNGCITVGGISAPISGAGGLKISYTPNGWTPLVGSLDEVAVYADKALPPADVAAHWNAGR